MTPICGSQVSAGMLKLPSAQELSNFEIGQTDALEQITDRKDGRITEAAPERSAASARAQRTRASRCDPPAHAMPS
jgi:hypothetical protein